MSIRGEAAVVGFHELPTQKDYAGRSALGLMAEASHGAIRDAGLRKEDIDGLIAPEGINSITVAEYMRIQPHWTTSVTAHGASGATSVIWFLKRVRFFNLVNPASGERSVMLLSWRSSIFILVSPASGVTSVIWFFERYSSVALLSFASRILASTSRPP